MSGLKLSSKNMFSVLFFINYKIEIIISLILHNIFSIMLFNFFIIVICVCVYVCVCIITI